MRGMFQMDVVFFAERKTEEEEEEDKKRGGNEKNKKSVSLPSEDEGSRTPLSTIQCLLLITSIYYVASIHNAFPYLSLLFPLI